MNLPFGCPYIGMTDFTNYDQVWRMLAVYRAHSPEVQPQRRLHVGVMMSRKTLNDEPTKYTVVFPPKECIAPNYLMEAWDTFNRQ